MQRVLELEFAFRTAVLFSRTSLILSIGITEMANEMFCMNYGFCKVFMVVANNGSCLSQLIGLKGQYSNCSLFSAAFWMLAFSTNFNADIRSTKRWTILNRLILFMSCYMLSASKIRTTSAIAGFQRIRWHFLWAFDSASLSNSITVIRDTILKELFI